MKAIVVTVTYGTRLEFLKQVVAPLLEDELVSLIVIVDNGSYSKEKLENLANEHPQKIYLVKLDKNMGSAAGFARGLEFARKQDCTHIFLLDDDNVPERNALQSFCTTLNTFVDKEQVILCGSRNNLTGNSKYFIEKDESEPLFTFFDIFNTKKMYTFVTTLFGKEREIKKPNTEMVIKDSFAYGGTLIPISAVRDAPLPDESLVLYGDDIEYSWNIKKLGYTIYACSAPVINDIDLTFGQDTHITGLFDENTKPFKVFYRIRNMVYLSLKHSRQYRLSLYTNMFVWILGLFLLGAWKKGVTRTYFKRVHLVALAVYAGFNPKKAIPEEVVLP